MSFDSIPVVNPHSTGLDVSGFSLAELFPSIDPGLRPYGSRVLIQLRRVINMSKGGIALPQSAKDTEEWNMQVGKLIAVGELAFKNRKTFEDWPEGVWAQVGDFVRFPRWGGDRITVPMDDGIGGPVTVLILNDHDLLGAYTGDVRNVRSFIQ